MELAIELCNPIFSVRHTAHLSIKHSPPESVSGRCCLMIVLTALFAVGIVIEPSFIQDVERACYRNVHSLILG